MALLNDVPVKKYSLMLSPAIENKELGDKIESYVTKLRNNTDNDNQAESSPLAS